MEIKQVKINNLKPAEYNPRSLTEKEYKDLENSLKRFGFVEPLVVNSVEGRENVVIGRYQRIISKIVKIDYENDTIKHK